MKKITLGIFVLAFCLTPFLAQAETTTRAQQLLKMISQLKTKMEQLQTQVNSLPGRQQEALRNIDCRASQAIILALGSRVKEVAFLQRILIDGGYLTSGSDTGYFGTATRSALLSWQQANNLPTSGLFDRASRARICGNLTSDANSGENSASAEDNSSSLSNEVTNNPGNSLNSTVGTNEVVITIKNINGPISLMTGRTGQWRVAAFSEPKAVLRYSADWGDSTATGASGRNYQIKTDPLRIQSSGVFNHRFAQAGTYKIKFVVSSLPRRVACIKAPCPLLSATSVAREFTVVVTDATSNLDNTVGGESSSSSEASQNVYNLDGSVNGSTEAQSLYNSTGETTPAPAVDTNSSISCQTSWYFDNDNHSACQQRQFCGSYLYYGLRTFTTKERCEAMLNVTFPKVDLTPSEPSSAQADSANQTASIWQALKVLFRELF